MPGFHIPCLRHLGSNEFSFRLDSCFLKSGKMGQPLGGWPGPMTFFVVLASLVMALHLLFILWVVFGALLTHRRPLLSWLHLASFVLGTVVDILPWACSLTSR